jgi:hypothetical protein
MTSISAGIVPRGLRRPHGAHLHLDGARAEAIKAGAEGPDGCRGIQCRAIRARRFCWFCQRKPKSDQLSARRFLAIVATPEGSGSWDGSWPAGSGATDGEAGAVRGGWPRRGPSVPGAGHLGAEPFRGPARRHRRGASTRSGGEGSRVRGIVAELGRGPATVSREPRRNRGAGLAGSTGRSPRSGCLSAAGPGPVATS